MTVYSKNLTSAYGSKWDDFSLHPFRPVKEYNARSPSDRVTLGII